MAQTQAANQGADAGAGDGHGHKNFWALTLGWIGVVYGDIGTSPLYAFKEAIHAATGRGLTAGEASARRAVAHPLEPDPRRHREVRADPAPGRQQAAKAACSH